MNLKKKQSFLALLLALALLLSGCAGAIGSSQNASGGQGNDVESISLEELPVFNGEPYVVVNGNQPDFTGEQKQSTAAFENYSELDELGRCGVAFANICKELMPTEERQPIGQVRPSGWHTVKYNGLVDGNYLYNRCHLIAFQLAGENANEKNLITGTRYFNVEGMLPFEEMVGDYVRETGNHVLYRVTPIYEENNLVASGVQMEAWSVEDEGEGICFNVYCYNVQPGVEIHYLDGSSNLKESDGDDGETIYILNTNTKKFHRTSCASVEDISKKNKKTVTESREQLVSDGYSPCGNCNP
ncbi:MAG: DNA/RNA non-specific endonuclease [Lachnospiraceae bacterium]